MLSASNYWTVHGDPLPGDVVETVCAIPDAVYLPQPKAQVTPFHAEKSAPPKTSVKRMAATLGSLPIKGRIEAMDLVRNQLAWAQALEPDSPLFFLRNAAEIAVKILNRVEAMV